MAVTISQIAEHLASEEIPEFKPQPFYERHTDSLIFYVEDTPSYGNRLNQLFTLFLADDDDRLVGIEIKGFKGFLERIRRSGLNVISATNKTVKLSALAQFSYIPEPENPNLMDHLESIGRFDVDVDLEKLTGNSA